MKALISIAIGAVIFLLTFLVVGCSQRECTYNPETGLIHYKSNSLCTFTRADRVTVVLPSGARVEINRLVQDNDSIKLKYNPVTGTVEVVTNND